MVLNPEWAKAQFGGFPLTSFACGNILIFPMVGPTGSANALVRNAGVASDIFISRRVAALLRAIKHSLCVLCGFV